jgi:hypothetical protein
MLVAVVVLVGVTQATAQVVLAVVDQVKLLQEQQTLVVAVVAALT